MNNGQNIRIMRRPGIVAVGLLAVWLLLNSLLTAAAVGNGGPVSAGILAEPSSSPRGIRTEAERAKAQQYINNGYELFTRRCADGRKMKQDDIKKIGEGRVWTGIHAKQIGLVDEMGGLDDAIAKAKQLAKLDEASVMNYPAKKNMLEQLMEEMHGTSYADKQLQQALGDYYPIIADMKKVQQKTGVQTALPYRLKFNL